MRHGRHQRRRARLCVGEVGDGDAVAQHEYAVRALDDLLQFRGDHQHAEPEIGEFADEFLDLRLGADIDAARRLVEDEQLRVGAEPAREQNLLLIAAAQLADLLLRPRRLDREALDEPVDDLALALLVDHARLDEARQDGEREILAHRHVRHDAVGLAVLAAIAQPAGNSVRRLLQRDRLAVEPDRPGVGGIGAEDRARGLRAAGAEQAGEADDLALAHLDPRVAHAPADLEALRRQHLRAGLTARFGKAGRAARAHRLQAAAEHGGNEAELVDVLHGGDEDRAPVAHHGHAVADLIEFVEPVGDEDHGDALGAQLPHHLEQHGNLALVERGGRLVHDDQLGLERHRAGDGDHLLDRG